MSERYPPLVLKGIHQNVIVTFEIPGIPPSWNEIMRLPRVKRRSRGASQWAEGEEWKETVGNCALFLPRDLWDDGVLPFPEAVVSLIYHFPDAGRRDPDNYSGKFIMDGLVAARLIVDDSFACVDLVIMRGDDDPGTGFVEVQLCPR